MIARWFVPRGTGGGSDLGATASLKTRGLAAIAQGKRKNKTRNNEPVMSSVCAKKKCQVCYVKNCICHCHTRGG